MSVRDRIIRLLTNPVGTLVDNVPDPFPNLTSALRGDFSSLASADRGPRPDETKDQYIARSLSPEGMQQFMNDPAVGFVTNFAGPIKGVGGVPQVRGRVPAVEPPPEPQTQVPPAPVLPAPTSAEPMGGLFQMPERPGLMTSLSPIEASENWTRLRSLPSGRGRGNVAERFLIDPVRVSNPGIYQDPRVIARQAVDQTAPEHPALKELFGVTRDDLYGISRQGTRQGNAPPNIWFPNKPGKPSYAAQAIMTPANAQRMVDVLVETGKYPQLSRGMDAWYVMDPAYQRLEQLVGPDQAKIEYNRFNSTMTPFSANSDVLKEINRGTGARYAADAGLWDQFSQYGGLPAGQRPANYPQQLDAISPHLRHGGHIPPAQRFLDTGAHGYQNDTVKVPLYTQASGVPQTGFQTAWPVPDAHLARGTGIPDVRKNEGFDDYMGGSEYRTFAPWYREKVAAPVGIEAVPAQGRMWAAFGPQTGVKTPLGAPKLELFAQRIWEEAKRRGVDPQWWRDQVLLGKGHAAIVPGAIGTGALFSQPDDEPNPPVPLGAAFDPRNYQFAR